MEEEFLSINEMIPVDLDISFTSSTTSSSSFATSTTFSARSSLSLSLPSFSSSSSVTPLPHSHPSSSWSAINTARSLSPDGLLHLRHLHLLRHLGSGHLARVFHCRLKGSSDADFALKVVDLRAHDDSISHVRAEARALAALDHPFLPTLYARLDASHYSCFLIDYCPGGDLHGLLRRRHGGRLPPAAARFYAAEVLLALEYLHALGFVYRDLKPENVLLRADGHVMLSDFDLAFVSPVTPSLHRRRRRRRKKLGGGGGACGCFGGHVEEDGDYEEVEFVAEPEAASSKDCVGTHEYLAPEVADGNGHGNGVDWWAFGVFLYEMLYGRTPFKGPTKEATLRNVLNPAKEVRFPHLGGTDSGGADVVKAKDLIGRLLERDPRKRMGAKLGAAEVKRHPFFAGVDWALIRCVAPPVVTAGGAQEGRKQVKWGSWNNLNGRSSSRRRSFFNKWRLGSTTNK